MHRAVQHRVLCKRLAWVGHLSRVLEQTHLALIGHRQLLERGDHVDAQTASIHCIVATDARAAIYKADPPAWQIHTHGHLCVSLVDPIPNPEPAANLIVRIEHVQIHRLVVVRHIFGLMGVFVFGFKQHAELWIIHSANGNGCARCNASNTALRPLRLLGPRAKSGRLPNKTPCIGNQTQGY